MIATIWLDAPPLNVLSLSHLDTLRAHIAAAEADASNRFLVLRGAGERAFSAGVDIKDHTADQVPAMLERMHGVVRALWQSRLISVAAIHRHALGGGLELALACDFTVATENATLAFPEIDVGCYPPVAVALLEKVVGLRRALEMVLLARPLTASEALQWGLIHAVGAELEPLIDRYIESLQKRSPAVMRMARDLMKGGLLDRLSNIERHYTHILMAEADAREGVQAFLERRPPQWAS